MSEQPTDITFTAAYDELKGITERLNNEEVEADELVDLLRRGKGLEAVLRAHLTGIEQEVTAIENGEGIAAYRIVRGSAEASDVPADTSDFENTEPVGSAGDDIPF